MIAIPTAAWSAPAPHTQVSSPPDPTTEPAFWEFEAWLHHYRNAAPSARTAHELHDRGLRLADLRRIEMTDLIRSDPRRALELAIAEDLRAELPPTVRARLEQWVRGTGDYEVLSICGTPEVTRLVYKVRLAGKVWTAHPFGALRDAPCMQDLPISGIALDGHLALNDLPDALHTGHPRSAAPSNYTTGTKRAILIRVDFSDLPGASFTDAAGAQLVRELDSYYRAQSYNLTGFHPVGEGTDITPTYRMPLTAASYGGNDLASELRQAARQAARDDGYNLDAYDFDLTCMANVSGFGWAGLGYVGAPGVWIRGNLSLYVVAHELGHNFGLGHAKFHDTSGFSTIGNGVAEEYGDKFDVMGSGGTDKGFNAYYRNFLGWLPDSDVLHATESGLFTIQDFTPIDSTDRRLLHIRRDSETDYYFEFRQDQTGYPAMLQGAILRRTRDSSRSTDLLDTHPSSSQGKNDSALPLGKSFSDPEAGIHVTPLSIRSATPSAVLTLDVQLGPQADNRPPAAIIDAYPEDDPQSLQLHAEAADPDGDTLAYHWDFGDGTFAATPNASHEWSENQTYPVRALISDRKGGLTVREFEYRPGSHTGAIISGRVTDPTGAGVSAVRIFAPMLGDTYTDPEGRYSLSNLASDQVTLYPEKPGFLFLHPAFSNPVPNTAAVHGIDWIAIPQSELQSEPLISRGDTWRYWDLPDPPAAGWTSLSFDDNAWGEGQAELGYGDRNEMTVIGYGPDPNNKTLTAYFRRSFEIEQPQLVQRLILHVVRDDGAVVYLNGQEILRDNMPSGRVTHDTTARNSVGGADESRVFQFAVSPDAFRLGTNQIAVEVHQIDATSSDLSFDLGLTAERITAAPKGVFIQSPTAGEVLTAPANLVLSMTAASGDSTPIELVHCSANGIGIGHDATEPYRLSWRDVPAGRYTLQAVARTADGEEIASAPVRIDVAEKLIAAGSSWRYLDTGVYPGPNWTLPAFDDSAWLTGPAPLGYGGNGEVTTVRYGTNATSKHITTYFRTTFSASDAAPFRTLHIGLQCDDGAAVYLNGRELVRTNLPHGTISRYTLALEAIGGDDESRVLTFNVPADDLREGVNCLAVEVHQAAANSSDLSFDLSLRASLLRDEPPPPLRLQPVGPRFELQWEAAPAVWRLETTPSLDNPTWGAAHGASLLWHDQTSVLFESDEPAGFFRLR